MAPSGDRDIVSADRDSLDPFELNLRHLVGVSELVRRRRMAATAGAIGLSQPALTQGLRKLEEQLGAALFDRRSEGMHPTEAGQRLAERADRAVSQLRKGLRSARSGRTRPELAVTGVQLRALLSLADHGSFAVGAQALGLAEGTLHRAVRGLEHALSVPLAVRRGRGIALTPQGERVARATRLMAREISAAIAEVGHHSNRRERVTIGAMPLCRAQLLPRALHTLLADQPGVNVRVVEGSWNELVEPLRDGALDLMIGALREDPAPPDLFQQPLFEDRLVIVAGSDHPLCGVAEPTLDQLASYDWVVGPAESPLRHHWERLFRGRTLPAAPITCGSVMTIRELLRASPLLTLLSPAQVAVEVDSGTLKIIGAPLKDGIRTIGVTMRAGWRPTPAQETLLEALAAASAMLESNRSSAPGTHAR